MHASGKQHKHKHTHTHTHHTHPLARLRVPHAHARAQTVQIGAYSVKAVGVLGEGGLATVYHAVDASGAAFAVKHMRLADADAMADMAMEAQTLSKVRRPPPPHTHIGASSYALPPPHTLVPARTHSPTHTLWCQLVRTPPP
eukprot:363585-Chlamydomonas_euryale.AAC.2